MRSETERWQEALDALVEKLDAEAGEHLLAEDDANLLVWARAQLAILADHDAAKTWEFPEAAEWMNRLPFVRWDRAIIADLENSAEKFLSVYGWIARPDGRSDYVLLEFAPYQQDHPGWATSSAEHSEEIGRIIDGPGAPHYPCQRVDDLFGDLVPNRIDGTSKAAAPIAYLVQGAEYDDQAVYGVYTTLDVAVAVTTGQYGQPPYRVDWNLNELDEKMGGGWELVGDFADVPGYSVGHRKTFSITKVEIES